MDGRGKTGKQGEDLVCRYLMDKGHTVLERNWRSGHLEIDIITQASDGIHFVEVKSRKAPVQAPPEENVGWLKQKRTATAARRYLAGHGGGQEAWLDVAAVTFYGDEGVIDYIPNAYVPIYI